MMYLVPELPERTDLRLLASLISALKTAMLCTETDAYQVASEEHYQLALVALDAAATHLRLADHFATRERANEALGR